MKIVDNLIVVSLQYQLETFTEGRNSSWAYEPFTGKMKNRSLVHSCIMFTSCALCS